ncbi:MAG TPA: hypothetical protein VK559_02870 [Ferruginibacter sp.]|nr:hypothetical protein [Ferruginibacter sp.]
MLKLIFTMRKSILYILIGVLMMVFTACTKTVVVPTQSENYNFEIDSSDWTYIPATGASGPVWDFNVSTPAITSDVLNFYAVMVYWTQDQAQTLMPFTLSGVDYDYITAQDSNGVGYLDVEVPAVGNYASLDPSTPSLGTNDPVFIKVVIIPQ